MGWYRGELTEEQQQVVNAERDAHPDEHVRRKMLVLCLLHHGLTRGKAAEITGTGRATVQRYVAAFRDGGLDGMSRGQSATWPATLPRSASAPRGNPWRPSPRPVTGSSESPASDVSRHRSANSSRAWG